MFGKIVCGRVCVVVGKVVVVGLVIRVKKGVDIG